VEREPARVGRGRAEVYPGEEPHAERGAGEERGREGQERERPVDGGLGVRRAQRQAQTGCSKCATRVGRPWTTTSRTW
jgi:hypothetical protein